MRIIAGLAGGRALATPRDRSIRPTTDLVREALFSILGDVRDVVVVDGYAGTGAMGCEALSRGASHCYFIDKSPEAIALVEENLERIDARDRGIILPGEFSEQLDRIADDPDLWLLDPPYPTELAPKALEALAEAACVTEGALVVIEQDENKPLAEHEAFDLEDGRTYGRNRIAFYRRR